MKIDTFDSWLNDANRKPLVMGILNVTPDSFSDGGKYNITRKAVEHALSMENEGVDIIDIGGESSRPGAMPVSIAEELNRVIPVIKGIRKKSDILISIDTYKSKVAEEAITTGVNIINDISGLRFDDNMIIIARDAQCPVVVMHMLGNPQNMQDSPAYSNITEDIIDYFNERITVLADNGILKNNIILDPGIGFGKTTEHNLTLLRELRQIVELGHPVLVGPSLKSFIGNILKLPADDRIEGTSAAVTTAIMNGSHIVRVHDIREMVRVVTIAEKICAFS